MWQSSSRAKTPQLIELPSTSKILKKPECCFITLWHPIWRRLRSHAYRKVKCRHKCRIQSRLLRPRQPTLRWGAIRTLIRDRTTNRKYSTANLLVNTVSRKFLFTSRCSLFVFTKTLQMLSLDFSRFYDCLDCTVLHLESSELHLDRTVFYWVSKVIRQLLWFGFFLQY